MTSLSDLRASVEALETSLPDSEFGFDLTPIKTTLTKAYNALNDLSNAIDALAKRVAALEAKK
jgi:hypothetical protein